MVVKIPIPIANDGVVINRHFGNIQVTAVSGGGGGSAGKLIQRISLHDCKWQKNLNQLIIQWDKTFPTSAEVFNPKTNIHRTYVHLTDSDPRFDQDGWDGEQMVYKTYSETNGAEYLVLYHGS